MSGHTKGPWVACIETFAGRPSGFHIAASPHGSTKPLCELGERAAFEPSELEANARLIAAAPTMLAALKDAVEVFEIEVPQGNRTIERMHAAIAKAEGRS